MRLVCTLLIAVTVTVSSLDAHHRQLGAVGCDGQPLSSSYALVLEETQLQLGAGLGTGATSVEENEEALVLDAACDDGRTWYLLQALRDTEREGWVEASTVRLADDGSTAPLRIYGETCYVSPSEFDLQGGFSLTPVSHLMAFEHESLGDNPVFLFEGSQVSDEDVFYVGPDVNDRAVYGIRARWVLRQSSRDLLGDAHMWNEATNWQVVTTCAELQPPVEATPAVSV